MVSNKKYVWNYEFVYDLIEFHTIQDFGFKLMPISAAYGARSLLDMTEMCQYLGDTTKGPLLEKSLIIKNSHQN